MLPSVSMRESTSLQPDFHIHFINVPSNDIPALTMLVKVTFLVEQISVKEEWRSSTVDSGEQFVMTWDRADTGVFFFFFFLDIV